MQAILFVVIAVLHRSV